MLHLHRAERADRLAGALGELIGVPPADPFTAEVIAVPTRGMERWLTQRLSARLGAGPGGGDGVCANVEFPFPGRLLGGALATASGIVPDADPWLPERMVWPLLETVEAHAGEPWLAPLERHLATAPERRFARLRLVADLFDHYAVRRPELLAGWASGAGGGADWQSALWLALRERIGVPSPAERLGPACTRLREAPGVVELPARLAVFGLTRLAPAHLGALTALAAGRDVHLFLLHPSPALWERLREPAARRPPVLRRAEDPTAHAPRNRLLASWGRESRELQLVLGAGTGPQAGPLEDHHHPLPPPAVGAGPDALLTALQADIRADRAAPGAPLPDARDGRLELAPDDLSVRVHACHGRGRQVEVIREAILHALAADPTLEPREVIVMCPDVETFAPLIEAAFGTIEAGTVEPDPGAAELRVRLADRALRRTNPLLAVLARLLELAPSRLTASQVLDLAGLDPVRRRFRLDDDDLARIQDWIAESGIHWGLDAGHRAAFRLGDVDAGTWAAGIRRVLVGVALSESDRRLYEGVLPIDDVESAAIELAGRFAELVDRLGRALRRLAGPHTLAGWAGALAGAADALTEASERDAWQRYELARVLDDVIDEAAGHAERARLALPEIRALLAHRLEGRPTRANFRTGHLTVCTLHPMRSVPHRVVCLLGLDDGAFPRHAARNGDDLLLADPHLGDRDPRAQDRQLLLDALLAARERLIITYSGNDERTNAPRPPAVPIGELLDAVDATARCPDGAPARDRVLVRHPLQPFDPRNFLAGRLHPERPWSFDPVALAGARALQGPRVAPEGFLPAPLAPAAGTATLALTDLIAFVERPVRAFLRQRLGITVTTDDDEVADGLPVELDALARWGVGQRLLDGVLAGLDPRECVRAEIARGTLPPGALGEPVIRAVRPDVATIARHARAYGGTEPPRSLETNVVLAGGRRLTGTVSGVRGPVLLAASFSRLGARQRLGAWVRLLALSAAHPDVAFEAVTVGRSRREAEVAIVRIPPLGRTPQERRDRALAELAGLAELRDRGLREPLPLPCKTAAAYAAAVHAGTDAAWAAGEEWVSPWGYDREDREREHVLAFGGARTLEELMAAPPAGGDAGPGGDAAAGGETSRFGALALRVWAPLLHLETWPAGD